MINLGVGNLSSSMYGHSHVQYFCMGLCLHWKRICRLREKGCWEVQPSTAEPPSPASTCATIQLESELCLSGHVHRVRRLTHMLYSETVFSTSGRTLCIFFSKRVNFIWCEHYAKDEFLDSLYDSALGKINKKKTYSFEKSRSSC